MEDESNQNVSRKTARKFKASLKRKSMELTMKSLKATNCKVNKSAMITKRPQTSKQKSTLSGKGKHLLEKINLMKVCNVPIFPCYHCSIKCVSIKFVFFLLLT